MKTLTLTVLCAGLLATMAYAQPVEQWQSTNGGADDEEITGMCATGYGGFIGVGHVTSLNDDVAYLVRFNADGTVMWSNTISDTTDLRLRGVCRRGTTDEYVAVGTFGSINGDSDHWLVRFNGNTGAVNGTILFDGAYRDNAWSIYQTPDGGYIIGGEASSAAYVLRLNASFSVLWQQNLLPDTNQYFRDIKPTSDGGYIAGGAIWEGTDFFDADELWVAKLDSGGNIEWYISTGGWGDDVVNSVIETPNGSFMACGSRHDTLLGNDDHELWAARISSTGTVQWSQYFGSPTGNEYGTWVAPAPTGFYFGGWGSSTATTANDAWLINLDGNGNMLWNAIYGGTGSQYAYDWCDLGDGAIGSAGRYSLLGLTELDAWGMRLDTPQTLVVDIAPTTPPLVVPANGGSFQYEVNVQNNSGSALTYDAWVQIQYLQTMHTVEVRYWPNTQFPANQSVSAIIGQSIPANAPGGDYVMSLYIGDHPWSVEAYGSFQFSKAGSAADELTVFDNPNLWPATGSFEKAEETVVAEANALPSEFSLDAAYPNPFNPSTTLNVNLPETADLTVAVYNVVGQQVAELAHGSFSAGSHTLTFDASHLSGGVYFVHASANSWYATQKVVLMK
ncbi:T9SS type A sorting domain-containing protein [bacterium]|nr:T9SS type A sorting domain-containing protein [bacterium]